MKSATAVATMTLAVLLLLLFAGSTVPQVSGAASSGTAGNEINLEFSLINALTDHPIRQLFDSETIYLDELPTTQLSIQANVVYPPKETVLSVWFLYGHNKSRIELRPPYALGGDLDGDYASVSWLAEEGQKTISVRALFASKRIEIKHFKFWIVKHRRPQGTMPIIVPPKLQLIAAPVVAVPISAPVAVSVPVASPVRQDVEERPTEKAGNVIITGELKKWHKVTLAFLNGPMTNEGATPNPFTDYRLDVAFTSGFKTMVVPGYYAADGDAANTGATSGSVWHCHFSPPLVGKWTWKARFLTGPGVSTQVGVGPAREMKATHFDGATGSFVISKTNKTGRDLRGKGLLEYVGKHHLRFAETGEWFLKAGSDSPENFLAYGDFDNTGVRLWSVKDWAPHVQDHQEGDPIWKGGKGKGIIGAVNYLSNQGMNAFSFLTFSLGGDDKNVFPHVSESDLLRIDVSKTAQWEVVLEHGDRKGMFLHFKTQETENDNILDGGELGPERTLYYRELIARFGHHLALNWNIGEENTNTDRQRQMFADYFAATDPYNHPVVVHTYIGEQNKVYGPLYGYPSFDGASIQTNWNNVLRDTLARVRESDAAGRPWIVANDEQGDAQEGVAPDSADPEHNKIRSHVLWGNIMAGGAGVEYYFGYGHDNSDLTCNDFRSRANMWKQSRFALEFFAKHKVPFQSMTNANDMISGSNWCLAERSTGSSYVLYLPDGGTAVVDLDTSMTYDVHWYDPRNGGELQKGSIPSIKGINRQSIGFPPKESNKDWVVLVRCSNGC